MKKVKRILAMLMAMAMVLGMAVTASAEEAPGTITIKNADNVKSVSYVQAIVANQNEETGWAFANDTIAQCYMTALGATDGQTAIKMLINKEATTDPKPYPTAGVATDGQIAAALKAVENSGVSYITNTNSPLNKIIATSVGVYVIKAEEEGYTYSPMAAYVEFTTYDTTTGVPSVLSTPEVDAKKQKTTVDKGASSDTNGGVTEIGRVETYTVTGEVPYISDDTVDRTYSWTDTISGAEYVTETVDGKDMVTVNVKVGAGPTYLLDKNYTAEVTTNEAGKKTFTVDLRDIVATNVYSSKTITVSYQATVTDTVVNNEIKVGAGNHEAVTDTSELVTAQVELTKTGENNAKLKDAKFILVRNDGKVAKFDANMKLAGWYDDEAAAKEGKVYKEDALVVTGQDGTVTVSGLYKGTDVTYAFKEVVAPEGYSINTDDAEVSFDADDTHTKVIEGTASMTDTKLAALPATGGIGTYIFTIAGIIIMAAAAGFFFVSRRKTNR